MSLDRSPPEPQPLATYLAEGARILAILLVWGVVGTVVALLVTQIGSVGSFLRTYGPGLGGLVVFAGVLNAALYVLYRAIDYWQAG